MTSDPLLREARRRLRMRAILMAIGLGAFVVLIYFITIARMAVR